MTDKEIYNKLQTLYTDDETLGCFHKGHCDMEQFKRVAVDFMKTECGIDVSPKYRLAVKGYYKVVPRGSWMVYHFSEGKMRGAFPVMEMRYA